MRLEKVRVTALILFCVALCSLAGSSQGRESNPPNPPNPPPNPPTLPTSGSEPPYEPEKWNAPGPPEGWTTWTHAQKRAWLETDAGKEALRLARVQTANSCYNYACNKRATVVEPGRGGAYTPKNGWCKTQKDGRVVPTTADDPDRIFCDADMNCDELKKAALADGLKDADCDKACAQGSYKKVLVLDPLTAEEKRDGLTDAFQTDYHWYRQDQGGNWSHKPGGGQATNQDAGDAPITDPRAANRDRYSEVCGCFCCGPGVEKA